jgi:hypothetical protein
VACHDGTTSAATSAHGWRQQRIPYSRSESMVTVGHTGREQPRQGAGATQGGGRSGVSPCAEAKVSGRVTGPQTRRRTCTGCTDPPRAFDGRSSPSSLPWRGETSGRGGGSEGRTRARARRGAAACWLCGGGRSAGRAGSAQQPIDLSSVQSAPSDGLFLDQATTCSHPRVSSSDWNERYESSMKPGYRQEPYSAWPSA